MAVLAAEIKYYLSGGAANSDPNASYGGAISSTEVGGSLNSLFNDVSGDEASAGHTDYRVIYVRNTSADATGWLQPIIAWIDQLTSGGDEIDIAVATAKSTTVTAGANDTVAPTGIGAFSRPTSKGAPGLTLPGGTYAQNDYCGIAIKRTVPASCSSTASDTASIKVEGDTV